jgi:hypothetical protein
VSGRNGLHKEQQQENKIMQNTERNDERNDGDGTRHYRRDTETTINMIWTL